jgi:putative membrane protein
MLIEFIIAIFIGIFAGTLSGLCPGIHINLVGAMLISSLAFFLKFTSPTTLIIFIVAMGITHTFIDFIPSIFLGAPEEDTVLSILPGHELLKQGQGYQAIYLSTLGSFIAIIIILLISPIFLILLPRIENIIKFAIPFLLIFSSIFLIFQEKEKLPAIIIFILSGFLGLAVLNSQVSDPLLPMLSGLFGISSLIISIKTKTQIPSQIIEKPKIKLKNLKKPIIAALLFSPLCSIFPAIGSGQAATLGATFTKLSKKAFLVLVGSTNTIFLGLSFIVLYSLGKSRSGMAANISEIMPNLTFQNLMIIMGTILITGIICFYWTLFLAKRFSKIISKINYQLLSIAIILIVTFIVFLISGFFGLFILAISSCVGVYGVLSGSRRINLMGCLLIPTILYYVL